MKEGIQWGVQLCCVLVICVGVTITSISFSSSMRVHIELRKIRNELYEANCILRIYEGRIGIPPITLKELEEEKEKGKNVK